MTESAEEVPEGIGELLDSLRPDDSGAPQDLQVLTRAAVKTGIAALKSQRIHEHFPAYLELRRLAVSSGSLTSLEPDWKIVSDLLKMPSGPPTKPHYRPFSSRNLKDESGYWYNPNLAGSYAPKSMRATSGFMLNASGDDYELPADHVQQALLRLLKGTKVPAWALAAYYLRNYGFVFDGDGGYDELVAAFKQEFAFEQGTDFDALFEDDEPIFFTDNWFEPLTVPSDPTEPTEGEEGSDV